MRVLRKDVAGRGVPDMRDERRRGDLTRLTGERCVLVSGERLFGHPWSPCRLKPADPGAVGSRRL